MNDNSGSGSGACSRGSSAWLGGGGGKGGAGASGGIGRYGRGSARRSGGGDKESPGGNGVSADSGGSQGSGSNRDSPMQCDSSGAGSEGGEGGEGAGEGNLALLCRAAFEFASTCSPLQTGSSAAVPPLGGGANAAARGSVAAGGAPADEEERARSGGGGGQGGGGGGFGSLGAGAGAKFLPSVTTWYQKYQQPCPNGGEFLRGFHSCMTSCPGEEGGCLGSYEDVIVKRERGGGGDGDAGSGSSSTPELGATRFPAGGGGVPSLKSELQASPFVSRLCCVCVVLGGSVCRVCLFYSPALLRAALGLHPGAECNGCMFFLDPALPTPSSSHSDQGQSICTEKRVRRHLPKRTPSAETIYSMKRPWVKRRQKRVPPTGMTPRYCQRRGRDRARRQTVLICPNALVRMCLCLYRSLFRACVLSLSLSTRREILKHADRRMRTRAPEEL
jgi:hypothetical protein